MENKETYLATQNTLEYVEQQKYNLDLPIHKSGIELASTIAVITTNAILITKQHLNCNPAVFDEYNFSKQRELFIKEPEKRKEVFLAQLSLNLSTEYLKELQKKVNFFLYDFRKYFGQKKDDLEYEIFKDSLNEIAQSEVHIENAYETYMLIKDFLVDTGVKEEIFEDMLDLMNRENHIKHTMH